MTKKILYPIGFALACVVCLAAFSFAAEGSGTVRAGYVLTDEDGHRGVNQETFNSYEGFALSVERFNYLFDNGMNLNANLRNVTLNNRNLYAGIGKPGLFNLSARNNQYRRTYDFDGVSFTRRRFTSMEADLRPLKNINLFGGFSRTDKRGDNLAALSPVADTVGFSSDYTHTSFHAGAKGYCPYGNLRVEYRRFDYYDDIDPDNDREANIIKVSAFSKFPQHNWLTLAAGYIYRQDKMYETAADLRTDQAWGATKIYLAHNYKIDYRLLYGVSKQEPSSVNTDHWVNTVSLSKVWPRQGGFRLGFENRIVDDSLNRTGSNGVLADVWYSALDRIMLKGAVASRSRDIKSGTVLIGDEDYSKYRVSAKYTGNRWGGLSLRYEERVKDNPDVNSKSDYRGLTGAISLKPREGCRMQFSYSYYRGQFENHSSDVSFEFADNVLQAMLAPKLMEDFTFSATGTYYRSHRDRDIEKLNLKFSGRYDLGVRHAVEVTYNLLTYDDFLVRSDYYTGNIIEINLIKDLKL
jgi:hypothetical protein